MNKEIKAYNIRVYGILINDKKEVLLSKEKMGGKSFTKFPGGGHQFGEGLIEGLKREFNEELGIKLKEVNHYYTTDFFQISAFNEQEQLISVYYLVQSNQVNNIKSNQPAIDNAGNIFFWKKVVVLQREDLTFPVDQLVAEKLIERE